MIKILLVLDQVLMGLRQSQDMLMFEISRNGVVVIERSGEIIYEKSTPYSPDKIRQSKHTFWKKINQFMLQNYITRRRRIFRYGQKSPVILLTVLVSFQSQQGNIE